MGHVQGMETGRVTHSDRGSPGAANRLRSFPKAPLTMRGKLGPGDLQETARRLKTEIVLGKSTRQECSLCSVNRVSSSPKTVYFKAELAPKMEILARWLSADLRFPGLRQSCGRGSQASSSPRAARSAFGSGCASLALSCFQEGDGGETLNTPVQICGRLRL